MVDYFDEKGGDNESCTEKKGSCWKRIKYQWGRRS
jgi:hypothetical protein